MAEPSPDLRRRVAAVLLPLFPQGKLIHAEQDMARPARPYATYRVNTVAAQRHLFAAAPDAGGAVTYRENGEATVEVQLYGGEAVDDARRAARAVRAHAAVRRFGQQRLGLIEVLPVQNVAELLNESRYEARAMFEFRCHYAEEFTEAVGLIATVEIDCFGDHADTVSAPSTTP